MDKLVILVILLATALAQQAGVPQQMPIVSEEPLLAQSQQQPEKFQMKVPQPDPNAAPQQSPPPASNPFQQRSGPANKGSPYDRRFKNDRAKFDGRRGMKARKDFSEQQRRRPQYWQRGSESIQQGDWIDAVVNSSIARFCLGVLLMGILVKLCLKRSGANKGSRSGGSKMKFSNSCFEDQVCIEDRVDAHPGSTNYQEQQ